MDEEKDFINLYDELIKILNENNKTIEDIKWIKSSVFNNQTHKEEFFEIDINNFIEIAIKTNYSCNGIGIPTELIIAGEDWWIERWETDDYGGFEFEKYPIRPKEIRHITTII